MSGSSTFVSADGADYELQMGRWSRRLAPLFVDFANIARGSRVLDVGCGTGSLSFYLIRNPDIAGVLGLDFSFAYVDHAKRKNHDPRLEFQVGDGCAMPFRDGSFDHALSMLALQFVSDAELAVREMRRVTRSGGTVAAATWDTRGGFVAYRIIFDAAATLGRRGNECRARAYTRAMSRPGDLARVWRDAGLINVVQDMRTIRMEFSCFEDFWGPAEGREGPVAEFVATLDAAAKSKLRRMVKLAYQDGEADGPRSYAATAWVVKGEVP